MTASIENPLYSVYVISGDTKYNVTPAVVAIDRSDGDGKIAQSVTIQINHIEVNGNMLSDLIQVRDRVYVYANDGSRSDEVFRGFVWARPKKVSNRDRAFQLKCYDNLIYFQESDESEYFTSGKSTKSVVQSLCDKWGVKLTYGYESITHSKLVLRGKLSDIFKADVLDLVKERTGKKYVILSEKDVMCVRTVGSNATIYHFIDGKNAIETSSSETMDGMITKVVIVGKADSDEREPVEATVSGDTSKYGTLQKIIDRPDNVTLEDAKKEAQTLIDENGAPKTEYEVTATDVPWIRKGDKVYLDSGGVKGYLIVTSIDRTHDNKKKQMVLTLEKE